MDTAEAKIERMRKQLERLADEHEARYVKTTVDGVFLSPGGMMRCLAAALEEPKKDCSKCGAWLDTARVCPHCEGSGQEPAPTPTPQVCEGEADVTFSVDHRCCVMAVPSLLAGKRVHYHITVILAAKTG